MMRSQLRHAVVAATLFGLSGCGGGVPEGMPASPTEYKPIEMPDAMKGGGMKPKVIPKPGTPGKGAEAPKSK
jgi:hypothetical protein